MLRSPPDGQALFKMNLKYIRSTFTRENSILRLQNPCNPLFFWGGIDEAADPNTWQHLPVEHTCFLWGRRDSVCKWRREKRGEKSAWIILEDGTLPRKKKGHNLIRHGPHDSDLLLPFPTQTSGSAVWRGNYCDRRIIIMKANWRSYAGYGATKCLHFFPTYFWKNMWYTRWTCNRICSACLFVCLAMSINIMMRRKTMEPLLYLKDN